MKKTQQILSFEAYQTKRNNSKKIRNNKLKSQLEGSKSCFKSITDLLPI